MENQKVVETVDQWVKHVEEVEAQEKLMQMASSALATAEELPATPVLEPTQQVEFEGPEDWHRGAHFRQEEHDKELKEHAEHMRQKREREGQGTYRSQLGNSALFPQVISSDEEDGTPQDMDVDIDLVSDEEPVVEVPDFIAYIMKPKYRHVSAEDMLAFLSSATRFIRDRIELNKARRGEATKNSSRIGKTYKKSKK